MTTEALKSTAITNLDASPIVANTAGHGAGARLIEIDGYLTVSASMAAGSTYQLVRVPSKAIVKYLIFASEAQGAGKFNLSVYYSDSTTDGTPAASQGVVVASTGSGFFAVDIDCASAVTPTDKTNAGGTYTFDKRSKQLWDAVGLTSDPGGFFDIVAVVHTTDVTTGTGKIYLRVGYVY